MKRKQYTLTFEDFFDVKFVKMSNLTKFVKMSNLTFEDVLFYLNKWKCFGKVDSIDYHMQQVSQSLLASQFLHEGIPLKVSSEGNL